MNTESIIASATSTAFGKPLVNNVLRSIISEAIVDAALDDNWTWCSADWAGIDFQHADGTRLEVKQSAALQSWQNADKKPSQSRFDIARRSGFWESSITWIPTPGRNADIYVFAYHPVTDDAVADHRDPSQWLFYVVEESGLPRVAKTISLAAVRKLVDPVGVDELNKTVFILIKAARCAWAEGDIEIVGA
ncbi:hypothetical protein [Mesorhizobium sp. A623]